ncbi:hypothetical protein Tco_0254557 [Tanacetum coccineum]
MWNNVANIPSFVPKVASIPAGSRNRPTSVPAGSRNRPTSVPADSRNRPTSVPAGSGYKPTSVPAGLAIGTDIEEKDEKRSQNEAKTTKPNTEWKSVKKTKSSQAQA